MKRKIFNWIEGGRNPLIIFGLIFISWFVILLGAWPGVYAYDAAWQYGMLTGDAPFTTHHPVIHTLWLGNCIRLGETVLGSANAGMLIYSLSQMIICASGLTYILCRVLRHDSPRKYIIFVVALAWIMLFPLNGVMAVCSIKDSVFAVLFPIVVLELGEFLQNTDRYLKSKRWILLISATFLSIIFRNNMRYAFAATGASILLISLLKKKTIVKNILYVFAAPLLLMIIYEKTLYPAFGITPGSEVEKWCVPIQQVAAVYNYSEIEGNEKLSESELNDLFAYASEEIWKAYVPECSNHVKDYFSFSAGKKRFVLLWARLLYKYPQQYIEAFVNLTENYWNPFIVQESKHISFLQFKCFEPVTFEPVLAGMYRYLYSLCNDRTYLKLPVIRLLFNNGGYLWGAVLNCD
ncbi:DUF6020 family protein [Butyrivibrio fibrisolvens]|uniref:DUF6020 family protein n=1 Tax=Butyrivibrio fibrisolvens TaxID=831 RepID=UPI0003B7A518|nr:DUF6020 family protein [Butyrivibrio fibrisolvens]